MAVSHAVRIRFLWLFANKHSVRLQVSLYDMEQKFHPCLCFVLLSRTLTSPYLAFFGHSVVCIDPRSVLELGRK
jgi:hypothetical protein